MSHHLGEDFWSEILQWLPARSLVQSRYVCRMWNSLISSRSFIDRHLSCAKPRLFARCAPPKQLGEVYLSLDYDENDATYVPHFDMDLIEKNSGREIVGSVNGVFCLSTYEEVEVYCPNFALWNPVIHKYVKLPRNRLHMRYLYPRSWFGFGFKASESDFRVLFVCCQDPGSDHDGGDLRIEAKFRVKICSVRSRSWRYLPGEILSQCTVRNPDSRCLLNGVLHLAAFNGTQTLLSFDFEQEVFSFMALPEGISANFDVAVYKDKLAVLDCDRRKNVPTCRIWSMREYGDPASWVCAVGVCLSPLSRTLIPIKERIAGLTADGRIIVARENGVFILRDPDRRRRRWLGLERHIRRIYFFDFVESLVFLDRESGAKSAPMGELTKGLIRNLSNTNNVASGKNQDMDDRDEDFEDEAYFEVYKDEGDKDKGEKDEGDKVEGDEVEGEEVEGDEVRGDGNIGGDVGR